MAKDKSTDIPLLSRSWQNAVPGSRTDLMGTHGTIVAFCDYIIETRTELHVEHKKLVKQIRSAALAAIDRAVDWERGKDPAALARMDNGGQGRGRGEAFVRPKFPIGPEEFEE